MTLRSKRSRIESMIEGAGSGPFWCCSCNEPCELGVEDQGIGQYEYWGATGVDEQLVTVSDCCGANFTEEDPNDEEN